MSEHIYKTSPYDEFSIHKLVFSIEGPSKYAEKMDGDYPEIKLSKASKLW